MSDAASPTRILLIDDDQMMQELIGMGLELNGYEVLRAENGLEAKELLGRESVDVIMVDLMMPVFDGLRFLRWLRGEAKSTVPVLVLTGRDRADTQQLVAEAGASGLIYKPVDLPELLEKLKELLTAGTE